MEPATRAPNGLTSRAFQWRRRESNPRNIPITRLLAATAAKGQNLHHREDKDAKQQEHSVGDSERNGRWHSGCVVGFPDADDHLDNVDRFTWNENQ
jgi:hypothetical protein